MPKKVDAAAKGGKSKDAGKSGGSKKAPAKKWTKGKVKEKSDNAVFVDQATYDRILTSIPKLGKHISTTHLIEKFKIVGSVARVLLQKAVENGSIRAVEVHSKQPLYTPTVQAVPEKPAATTAAPATAAPAKGKKK